MSYRSPINTSPVNLSRSIRQTWHRALDMPMPEGTPVLAAEDGLVVWSGERGGCGITVVIAHPDMKQTWYCHLLDTNVLAGQLVAQGARIGRVNNTGHSEGNHLHFEIRLPTLPRAGLANAEFQLADAATIISILGLEGNVQWAH